MQFVYAGIISWVVGKVIGPIVELLSSLLLEACRWVFNVLLKDVLLWVLKEFFDFALGLLGALLKSWLEMLEELIAEVLDAMVRVAGILVGAVPVSYRGKNITLLEAIMGDPRVRNLFLGIMILSVSLVALLSTYAMIKVQLDVEARQRRTAAHVARSVIHAMLTFASGYAYVVVVIALGSVLIRCCGALIASFYRPEIRYTGIINAFTGAFGIDYHTTAPDIPMSNVLGLDLLLGRKKEISPMGGVMVAAREAIKKVFGSEWEVVGFLVGFYFGKVMFSSMKNILGSIVRRIYDILVLFVTQPFYAATIVLDDGATYKRYRELFVGRVLSGLGTYLALLLMTNMWIPFVNSLDFNIGATSKSYSLITIINIDVGSVLVELVLRLALVYGGIKACEGIPMMLGQILNPQSAYIDMQSSSLLILNDPYRQGLR